MSAKSIKVAGQLSDLGYVAPEVVARRLLKFSAGGGLFSARDRNELARMSQEKWEAAWLSWSAMAKQAIELYMAVASSVWAIWTPGMSAGVTPSWEASGDKIISAGLAPYVRIAKANRTRLSRRR